MLRRIRSWWAARRHAPTARVVMVYPFDEPTMAGVTYWQFEQHTTDMLAYLLEEYR